VRITEVDAILLSCPLKEPLKLPFYGGLRTIIKRDAMIVRVVTYMGRRGFAPGPLIKTRPTRSTAKSANP